MVGLSVPELVLIGGIALVVFGPSKLPEVGGAIGKAIREFKSAMEEPERKNVAAAQPEPPKQIEAAAAPAKEQDSVHQ